MSEFKQRAELRTAELKKLMLELEKNRDRLMDEVASRKGQIALIEEVIKRCYEITLDVNKEEQAKEALELANKLKEETGKKAERLGPEEFQKEAKGFKTKKISRKRE